MINDLMAAQVHHYAWVLPDKLSTHILRLCRLQSIRVDCGTSVITPECEVVQRS
jgi:hypothetical protein